jgi:hypothetical protein
MRWCGLDEVAGFYLGVQGSGRAGRLRVCVTQRLTAQRAGEYCAKDVDLCYGIYQRMV